MLVALASLALGLPAPPPGEGPDRRRERTAFQTSRAYSDRINLGSDVAIVYGFGDDMPARVRSWRAKGYRVHLMTGASWGEYQSYLYGRFDGKSHEDEVQTRDDGAKISHGGDVYYMSPGPRYGDYLAAGVRKALEAGVEAVHLEEPEFWVAGGWEPSFRREWLACYGEPWQAPNSSVDAQWRSSKLKYFLYGRALSSVFDAVKAWNRENRKSVRTYVPTHSVLNYAHWGIVSPEASLAGVRGCDGYIAQVWTWTARTPNVYRGVKRERTFETAFLEYGAMQNLVRATGRTIWYLNDPVEDDPNRDWGDYRRNWESTLVASLLQPDVAKYEVAPWPERVFNDAYPAEGDPKRRVGISDAYATELQIVFNALNDMAWKEAQWQAGTPGIGVVVSDSLMFQRADPSVSDMDMGHVYGLALPLLKRGIPVEPVQLETLDRRGALRRYRVLVMSYQGQKPLGPAGPAAIAAWVRAGGSLVFVDDDSDPYNRVREWWNGGGRTRRIPREELFARLGSPGEGATKVGRGRVLWLRRNPADLSREPSGDRLVADAVRGALPGDVPWRESSAIVLRRGPYVVAAGLDESGAPPSPPLRGRFVSLFDPSLAVGNEADLGGGARRFLVDLDLWPRDRPLIAASGRATRLAGGVRYRIEGIEGGPAVALLRLPRRPATATLGGETLAMDDWDARNGLLRVRFRSSATPRLLDVR